MKYKKLKFGPATVTIEFKPFGIIKSISGDCVECHQFPCRHSGADFVSMEHNARQKD